MSSLPLLRLQIAMLEARDRDLALRMSRIEHAEWASMMAPVAYAPAHVLREKNSAMQRDWIQLKRERDEVARELEIRLAWLQQQATAYQAAHPEFVLK